MPCLTNLFILPLLLNFLVHQSQATTEASYPPTAPEVAQGSQLEPVRPANITPTPSPCLSKQSIAAICAYERLNMRHSSQVACFEAGKAALLSPCVTVRDIWMIKEGCKPTCLALSAIYAVATHEYKRLRTYGQRAAATCLLREGLSAHVLEPFGCRNGNEGESECARCVRIQDVWKAKQTCLAVHKQ